MRNMLALIGAAVVTFLGVGWYLDWFHVHPTASADGKKSYSVEINKTKIETDLHKGGTKLHGIIEKTQSETPPEILPPPSLDTSSAVTDPTKSLVPPSPFTLTTQRKDPEPLPPLGPEMPQPPQP